MVTFADISQVNPDICNPYDWWHPARSAKGEDPIDRDASRKHIIDLGEPDPGNVPPEDWVGGDHKQAHPAWWANDTNRTLRGRARVAGAAEPARCAVLVAEDDAATGALLRDVLAVAGHRVTVARGLDEAAGALATVRFDLVLAGALRGGAGGPRGDRWAALERVRALAGGAPVVVVTAHRPERYADWRARGIAALLATPLDLDDLLATVDRASTPRPAGTVRPRGTGARATPEAG